MSGVGRLIVVSGPSGVGKSTLLRELRRRSPIPLVFSVSATTRAPRAGERDGVDYHFLSQQEFHSRRERGEFLECFEVFGRGDWYGTLNSEVIPRLKAGESVLLEIDVNGAEQVLAKHPEAMTIFIKPSTMQALKSRLAGRGSESADSLARRIAAAEHEMAASHRFQYQVTNDDLERAIGDLIAVLCERENG